ncbi:MAG: flavin reductase family protein [Elusimicrobiota bacterium]|nr:flavin reductase family protein [Elusimicrobiota bacterium]
MKKFPLQKAFTFIEPGPVVLIGTFDNDNGRFNVMTLSWIMVMDFSPRFALLTGMWNHSCKALLKNKECVISIPTIDISKKVVGIGACSGADTDKFAKFNLTAAKAEQVNAPLIKECLANIECRVVDHIKKHDIFVLDGIQAWFDSARKEKRTFHAVGDGTFITDGPKINHRKLMADKLPAGV